MVTNEKTSDKQLALSKAAVRLLTVRSGVKTGAVVIPRGSIYINCKGGSGNSVCNVCPF